MFDQPSMPNLYPMIPPAPMKSMSSVPPPKIRRRLFTSPDIPVDDSLFPKSIGDASNSRLSPESSTIHHIGRHFDFPRSSARKRSRKDISTETSFASIGEIYAISPYGMNIYQFVQVIGFTPTGRPRVVLLTKITTQELDWSYIVKPGRPIEGETYTFSGSNNGSIMIDSVKYYLTRYSEYKPDKEYTDLPPL